MLASTVTTSPLATLTSDATTNAQLLVRFARKPISTFLPASSSNGSENHTFGGSISGGGASVGGGVNVPGGIISAWVSLSDAGAIAANTMPSTTSAMKPSVSGVAAPRAGSGWFGATPTPPPNWS